ncbi:hypothetical protein LZD49_33600 [Dyadobacter sp. CY261]|uniref:hypothetical protein n=1 Tax=Dyadobacter sp. CY261 TaxID=2907203 RepID=UPI001F1B0374|nr:hypothetical protein [Dyadobacter sp. CY261]MCF0075463.1 hypothetical protein [Dyadobacter sp. CY261]
MTLVRKYFKFPNNREEWCVTGEYGSLSFWVSAHTSELSLSWGETHYGGVENHYNEKSKPSYLDESAKHTDCNYNGGLCYHDGSSLWAEEHWIPYILPRGNEGIWQELEHYYERRLKPEQENNE